MVRKTSSPTRLIAQNQALDRYFETLLVENDPAGNSAVEDCVKKVAPLESKRPIEEHGGFDGANVGSSPVSKHRPVNQGNFLALFFDIGNMRLATPLQDLSRTINLPTRLNQLPNYPAIVIGSIQTQGEHIILLDTTALFEPSNPSAIQQHEKRFYKKALIIRNSHWGIPCDEVTAVVKLTPKEIQWRRSTINKSWLLGTEISQLRSLIDFNRLIPHQSST